MIQVQCTTIGFKSFGLQCRYFSILLLSDCLAVLFELLLAIMASQITYGDENMRNATLNEFNIATVVLNLHSRCTSHKHNLYRRKSSGGSEDLNPLSGCEQSQADGE